MIKNIGILLAAGRGTRLQPFTDTTPKPLVKYQGKTSLEWNMDEMCQLVEYYVVVVHWLSDQIISKIGYEYQGKQVIYAFQENPKGGTLDAFRVAISKIETSFTGLIVANSDDIRGSEYYVELESHIQKNPNEPVIAAKIEPDITKLSQFGVIKIDSEGKYQEMIEKPAEFVSDLINIGLYYFPAKILEIMPEKPAFKKALPINNPRPQLAEREEYLIDLFNIWAGARSVAVISPKQGFYKTITIMKDLPEGN